MKDFFKKKRLFSSKSAKTDTAKTQSSGKKFLNRFSKKKLETQTNPDVEAKNNTPTNVTNEAIVSEASVTEPAADNHSSNYTAPSTSVASSLSTNYNLQTWYSLKGRIGRVQLLAYSMIWGIIVSILFVAAMVTGLDLVTVENTQVDTVPILPSVLLLLMLPAWLYSAVILPRRRLHDSGKTGWWLLLYIVPLANLYLLYLLYLQPGDSGANKYGLPSTPYNKIELVLAILLPILSLVGMGLLSVVSSQMMLMQMAQQGDMAEIEVIDADAIDTETEIAEDVESTDAALEEIDPESAAQVQSAIDNAVNSESNQTPQVSYDDFLRESKKKILVDKSEANADVVDSEVFVDEQVDEANQEQVNNEAENNQ